MSDLVPIVIDETELLGLLRRHEPVAFHGFLDDTERLTRVFGVDFVQLRAGGEDFLGMDLDVGRLSLVAAGGLMDHDSCVGQRVALVFRPGHQQQGSR